MKVKKKMKQLYFCILMAYFIRVSDMLFIINDVKKREF